MEDFDKLYNEFLKDTSESDKSLRLLIDEIPVSKYSYTGMKLSDILPIYSNNRIIIHKPKKKNKNNTSNLF